MQRLAWVQVLFDSSIPPGSGSLGAHNGSLARLDQVAVRHARARLPALALLCHYPRHDRPVTLPFGFPPAGEPEEVAISELTGERPIQGATPDALLALHDAGYREVLARLGPGIVVDVGCGVGDETTRMTAPNRLVVGVDYDPATVVAAGRDAPAGVRYVGSDGARLGLRGGSIDWIVSSHVIEHFENPVLHVAELARVLTDDGTAFVITPNAPADFENPFHVYLFEPEHLVSLLGLFFDEVECVGLEGDDVLHADFGARRASGERLLRLDALGLRHRLPRSTYVWTYEHALPVVYRMLGRERSGVGSGIDASHFFVSDTITPTTPVLFATARHPRRSR